MISIPVISLYPHKHWFSDPYKTILPCSIVVSIKIINNKQNGGTVCNTKRKVIVVI